MVTVREITNSFLQLLFPHICAGCGSDLLDPHSMLCIRCLSDLPATGFQVDGQNPVDRLFQGRLPLVSATAGYFFTKQSLMQQLIHEFKYKGNKPLGLQLGRLLGKYLMQSGRFSNTELVPLPLFRQKEKKRGFNQAMVLCEGIAEILQVPVLNNLVLRPTSTGTQTKKGRIERWQNMEGKFFLTDADRTKDKHLLLIDDVITTGATIEACGLELLKAGNLQLSVAALCIASF